MTSDYTNNTQSLVSDLTKKIIGNTKTDPNLSVLCGFVSESEKSDYVKLYFTLEFDKFALVPTDKIRYHEHITTGDYPFGVTFVWIDKDSELELHSHTVTKVLGKDANQIISKLKKPQLSRRQLPETGQGDGPIAGERDPAEPPERGYY